MGSVVIAASSYDAVVFDMDGVVTDTANVHRSAWKEMFDGFLADRSEERRFSDEDYLTYVDGKPRYDGVRAFLEARGIELPEGGSEDAAGMETVCGLGNLKDRIFQSRIADHGVEVYASTVDLIGGLGAYGIDTALITSSRNASAVLYAAGAADLFEVVIDGNVTAERGLAGKPAPDVFIAAAEELNAAPARSVVIEDAISGVAAGRSGRFGLVIGVARHDNHQDLIAAGADVTVTDLAEVSVVAD